jgi:hypothetical protein
MSKAKLTLAVRLTAEQKQLLDELSKTSGRTMAGIIRSAVREFITIHAKRSWPEPPSKPPRPPLPPLPAVPRRSFDDQLRSFMAQVGRRYRDMDAMTAKDWPPLLAEYNALRRVGAKQVSSYWHKMHQHRALLDAGDPVPGVDKAERTILFAFSIYEELRNTWAQRTPVNRAKMAPEALLALQRSERKRQAKAREKKQQAKAAREAKVYVVDAESGTVTIPSPEDGEALDAAAE